MKLQSMTGFGQGVAQSQNFVVSVEIKSVNNRFKEVRFKLPSTLNALEIDLKKELNSKFSRGTFDAFVNIKRPEGKTKFDDLDLNKVNQFIAKMTPVFKENHLSLDVKMTDFLRAEFYLDQDETNQDELVELTNKAFSLALENLKISREQEGAKLFTVLLKHLENYQQHFSAVEKKCGYF